MIYPPVFEVCAAYPPLTALIGTGPVRLHMFGEAERLVTPPERPYVVWQQVGGFPENYVGDRPDSDEWSIQFDVYAETVSGARLVAAAVRDAIEGVAYVQSWVGDNIDPPTQLKRFTFTTSWQTSRFG